MTNSISWSSSLSAARQVRAAEADAPGGEEEGGGEAERPGGGDERLQQEEGGGRDALLISAPQERQGQEKVSQSLLSITHLPHSSFQSRELLFPTLLLSQTNPVNFSFCALNPDFFFSYTSFSCFFQPFSFCSLTSVTNLLSRRFAFCCAVSHQWALNWMCCAVVDLSPTHKNFGHYKCLACVKETSSPFCPAQS